MKRSSGNWSPSGRTRNYCEASSTNRISHCPGLYFPRMLYAALQAYRPRWHIENDGYRELKEGFGLEDQRWGRDAAAAHCRTTLTILAFNTTQVDRGRGGQRLARLGIRRLRRESQPGLGRSPVVIFMEDCYGVMAV